MTRILEPGRNCWRVERASRVAFLVDGAAYFGAVRAACVRARRVIRVLGWDLDSRLHLVRDGDPDDGYPVALGPLLNALVAERPELDAYVLMWDFALIYALERDFLPLYELRWRSHRDLHVRMNDRHPPGASQHEKIVAVDDAIAFAGGMDLGKWRWDTPAHTAFDPRRTDPDGKPYPPFHDVQVLVDGDAARALAERARERWARAGGHRLEPVAVNGHDPWPPGVSPDLRDVRVAIVRTEPAYDGAAEVREVQQLYLDAIAAAERWIYVENQYLTSSAIGDALAARLEAPRGPEVVLVLPQQSGGWLEQKTMDVLRARLLRRLRAADHHGRLRVYYPKVPGLAAGLCLNVHAKLMVVDDRLLRVGSANLSNRSMGLDTECDLAIEAEDEDTAGVIAGFRNRLLAEHLGVEPGRVAAALQAHSSLVAAVEDLRGGARSLDLLEGEVPESLDREVPESALIDPERPLDPDILADRLVHEEERGPARRRILGAVGTLVALLALAAAWRWTPLGEWLDASALAAWAQEFRGHPAAPAVTLAVFVLGGLTSAPVTVLIVVTALVFGPWLGFAYAMLGSLLSAAVTYGAGRVLGRDTVRRLAGERINRLSRRLGRRGITTMAAVRLIPIAPFTIVNLVAGASHIGFRDYLLGTALGMLPGVAALTVFADRLASVLERPAPGTVALFVVVVVVIAGGALAVDRWLGRRRRRAEKAAARSPAAGEEKAG